MKTILVTGGAGFIGSNLCRHLRDLGNNVTSLDNYFTGTENNHVQGVKYLNASTIDIASVVKERPDIVYHLGEYSRVEQSFNDFKRLQEYNMTGTRAVIDYCAKHSAKIIYAGSSTKFAQKAEGDVEAPYTWCKRMNTEYVMRYSEWFGLDYAVVYFYNVYGQNEISVGKYATLIARYTKQMREGRPLTVVAPGTQRRNFTHIDDIVSGLELVGNFGSGDLYGIGSEQKYSIDQVATMFGGAKEILPERPGNRLDAALHTDRIKELGWRCNVRLSDYIDNLRRNGWESA